MQFFKAHHKLYAYIFLVLLVFLRSFLNFPSLTWRAEFWAESGANFFCNAAMPFSLDVLFALDTGYLALLPRILSFLTVTLLGFRDYAPHAQQWAVFLVIPLCAMTLLKADWGEKNPNMAIKVCLASVLLLHWGYGMYVLNNVSYFAVLPIISFLGFSTADLNRNWNRLACFMPLLILNKPYTVAFLPGYLLFALYLLFKREFKASLPFILALILISIQFAIAHANRSTFSGSGSARFALQPLLSQLKTAGFFLLYGYETVFVGSYSKNWSYEVRTALAVCLMLAQILLLGWCLHKNFWRVVWFAGVCIVTAFICELMTSIVFFPDFADFSQIPTFIDDSHHFFAFSLIFLSLICLLTRWISNPTWVVIILLVLANSSGVFGFWQAIDPVPNLYPSPTKWEQQRALFHQGNVSIEINPPGWSFHPANCIHSPRKT